MNKIIPPTPSKADYTEGGDYEAKAEANSAPIFDRTEPFALLEEWLVDARAAEINDSNAMSLATVDADGSPDVRMVLLKNVSAQGLVFYTNAQSQKGVQLIANQNAALCFHWKSLRRQIRVRGSVEQVDAVETDAYFAQRARGSQLGAWSSDQSRMIESREALEVKVDKVEARFKGKDVPSPAHWHGWRVVPRQIEFWRDRPFRLHDRLLFERNGVDSLWTSCRLQP